VDFIDENGGGPGLRLRKSEKETATKMNLARMGCATPCQAAVGESRRQKLDSLRTRTQGLPR
jgi:hypothetical protein